MKHANIKQAHPENHCVIQAFGKSNKSKAFQRKVTLRPSQRNCKDSKGGGGVWFHTSVEGLDVPKSKCPVYENSQLLLQNGMEKKTTGGSGIRCKFKKTWHVNIQLALCRRHALQAWAEAPSTSRVRQCSQWCAAWRSKRGEVRRQNLGANQIGSSKRNQRIIE